jgi:hypothetical protein
MGVAQWVTPEEQRRKLFHVLEAEMSWDNPGFAILTGVI